MDDAQLAALVEAVKRELKNAGVMLTAASAESLAPTQRPPAPAPRLESGLTIDVPDPATAAARLTPQVKNPRNPEGLQALMAATSARIGVGHAGPRYTTRALLQFQGDHAVTQDALYRDVDQKLLDELGLFTVQTNITGGKPEYLLRPDLGRQLNAAAQRLLPEKCVKNANLQVVVGDGLSAAAVEANVRQILPILRQGAQLAGLTLGTPFFVKYARVGVMNEIGQLLQPNVVILLIGERPGLGRAEALSAYLGYKPKFGDTDADRDVVCNIFENGGTNPLEAGAFVLQIAQKMRQHGASGVKLKLKSEVGSRK